MKRITYLVYDVNANVGGELHAASNEEWKQIMAENRRLPREQRRFFTEDRIVDSECYDCMYIEVTKEEYDKWHSQEQVRYEKRKEKDKFGFVSCDFSMHTEGNADMLDAISDGVDLEDQVLSSIRMDELREALSKWRYWAVDMMDICVAGYGDDLVDIMADKFGVTKKAVREWRAKFGKFVAAFSMIIVF